MKLSRRMKLKHKLLLPNVLFLVLLVVARDSSDFFESPDAIPAGPGRGKSPVEYMP